jgi:methylated-DNA-protein-cysteine methyltransferase-like protein
MSALYDQIYEIVRQIPLGVVATYGQVAQLADMPHGAQVVGWALRALPKENIVPWQRVIAKGGRISIVNPEHTPNEQGELLILEGHTIIEHADGWYVENPRWFMH